MTMMLMALDGDGYDDDQDNVKGKMMLKLMMIEIVAMIHKTPQLGGCGTVEQAGRERGETNGTIRAAGS